MILSVFILVYILATIAIGIWANKFIKTSGDFIQAGRNLPFFLCSSALFATWFGSETILGATSEFTEKGIIGIIEDPFGASLCLLIVGLFFAKKFYRLNMLTICDFFGNKFGKRAELVSALLMIPSFFGWVAAQLVALGILFNIILDIPFYYGVAIGGIAVLIYTYVGGMWAISITDFIQTIIIVAGLLVLAFSFSEKAGGVTAVIFSQKEGFYSFFPEKNFSGWMNYIAAWITLGLGSIPSQDVFQRVVSAKNEKTAVYSSLASSVMYLTIAVIPLYLALCAKIISVNDNADAQHSLPLAVISHSNIAIQILFFGALISAILSSASGGVLAPATILAENLIKRAKKEPMTDSQLLNATRVSVIIVTVFSIILAFLKSNIYELVGEASAFTLVSLFVPLVGGMFFRINEKAAIASMFSGIAGWATVYLSSIEFPAVLAGLFCSFTSAVLFSLKSKTVNG